MPERSDIFFRYLEEEQGKHKERALTSASYRNKDHTLEDRNTNCELATYGDALLKFVLSELLLDQVGNITEEKKNYESDEVLVKVIARRYDLCRYIRLDDSNADIPRDYEYKESKHKSYKYIATAVEALLAAYYLDHEKKLEPIFEIVEKWKDMIYKTVFFPYGKEQIVYNFEGENFCGVLMSRLHEYTPEKTGVELVKAAMDKPIGSPRLSELAVGKKNVVIIASDHTRPVPSKIIIPPMLGEIRSANPRAQVTILIATGCHRETTREELVGKFGEDIVKNENIVIHDCADRANLVKIGTLPSGGELWINRLAYEADLLVSEGFIEPHFFAGFSGGRKSVLPGIAARESVLANHCSEFIAHPKARTGVLEGNPIHEDMLWAAGASKLAYIVNVVINEKKEAIYAVAGDVKAAHRKGCEFLLEHCRARPIPADIVISTNGGYPLDQNVYQAVKGMTAAEATVREGGVIVMLAKSNDGHGGEGFYRQLADQPDIDKTLQIFLSRGRGETVPDQWQTQIFLRILKRATVVYVSDAEDSLIRDMHMIPAHSLPQALAIAKDMVKIENPSIVAIPDGVAVMVVES